MTAATPTPDEPVVAHIFVSRADFEAGWNGDLEEFRLSVAACAREIIGDDGGDYFPVDVQATDPRPPQPSRAVQRLTSVKGKAPRK